MKKNIKDQLSGKKILFATMSADGHINPLTGLACFLLSWGCDVRWYTSELYRNKIEKLDIPFFPYNHAPDINGTNVDKVFPERKTITDVGAKANFDMKNIFAEMASGAYKDIQEIHEFFQFDIVIADSAFTAIPLIRHGLQKPVIAIGIIPLAEESVDLGPFGPGLCPPANEEQRNEYAGLRQVFNNIVFKEAIDTYSAILEKHHVPHQKTMIFDAVIRQANLYLQIGTPSFEYERSDIGENVRFIGSLLPQVASNKNTPWFDERLNDYSQVVLVTQGTVESDITKIIEPTLEAFKASETLVIATTGGNQTVCLRAKYPYANLIIEDYLPFADVMPYANVYITNGGYSGTLLSIKNKLPIVAAGIYEGKAEVCSRIGFFKYGINLNTETPTAVMIKGAVEEVTSKKGYKNNVIRLSLQMERYNANNLCARYIIGLLDGKPIDELNFV
ncbi:glycosyltransferase [Mucilaginibacter gynuensis]|uniref:Glycosyltransferase n=1 Tax=Mucilaginibacter gynuensis TaxID=1302236 RepID=A0ABP8GGJ0_9SPHI